MNQKTVCKTKKPKYFKRSSLKFSSLLNLNFFVTILTEKIRKRVKNDASRTKPV